MEVTGGMQNTVCHRILHNVVTPKY